MKERNKTHLDILDALLERGPMTRDEIGVVIGRADPTVRANINDLRERKLVEFVGYKNHQGKRGPAPEIFGLHERWANATRR